MKEIDEQIFNEIFEYVSKKYGIELIIVGEQLKNAIKNAKNPSLMAGYIMATVITSVLYIEQTDAKINDVVSDLLKNFNMPDF